jgi:hypothetical protein
VDGAAYFLDVTVGVVAAVEEVRLVDEDEESFGGDAVVGAKVLRVAAGEGKADGVGVDDVFQDDGDDDGFGVAGARTGLRDTDGAGLRGGEEARCAK